MSEIYYCIKTFILIMVCASCNGKVQSRLPADGPLYTERLWRRRYRICAENTLMVNLAMGKKIPTTGFPICYQPFNNMKLSNRNFRKVYFFNIESLWATPWLKLCVRSDPNLSKCVNEMFIQMFPQLAVGIPEANISPFEPLYIDKVSVSKGAGPITLMGSFLNLTVAGPSNATSTFTDLDIAKRKMYSGIYLPLLDIKAQYNLKGKILLLPLVGHGGCELKLFQVDTKVKSDLSFPKVEGREILRIDHMSVTFSIGSMQVNLHNLFNGNKVLGQTLNGFVNQNSQEVLNELSESIGQSLGEILKELMNEVFSKIPTDLWLIEETQDEETADITTYTA